MSLIHATNLTKTYPSAPTATKALDGFSLEVESGRIVGLIGPNGAGKTTALRAILGLTPVQGQLDVLGLNPFTQRDALMRSATFIADVGILPRWMKVNQLIDFVDGVHPGFEPDLCKTALKNTDISLTQKVSTLSKGMVTQLHLALILAIDARLLVLDEPTLGLDIIYRQHFYNTLLNEYYQSDRSILISTHEVREIEHLLTDVVFINHGRVVLSSSMDAIAERYHQVNVPSDRVEAARALNPLSELKTWEGYEFIFQDQDIQSLETLGQVKVPNLPELFIACMGDKS